MAMTYKYDIMIVKMMTGVNIIRTVIVMESMTKTAMCILAEQPAD